MLYIRSINGILTFLTFIKPYKDYMKTSFYSKEYLEKLYPTEESYIRYMTEFSTYAVLTPDGEWYEPGKMGWWGLSYATPEEERNFSENYVERFIKTIFFMLLTILK